ncbi:AEC family transporter [Palleronia sp. LCG004]|uniref:AEC family transporter n=1 Tax=Palleronia sp. LCG004 TaxID=3079304 RepID=UPI002943EABA|nr:AEC family transporter [Palleronia sp. LCG004]WOI56056.1 AEC family transporter [Palleronia sp. LCG004]
MLLLTIWPIFGLICLGFALARTGIPGTGFWPMAERINYVLLFPALLVVNLAGAPLGDPSILRLGGATLATITLASAVFALAAWPVRPAAARFGPALQGIVRFNTYLGLAIVASVLGDGALGAAAVLLAVAVPLVNVLSVMALSYDGHSRGIVALLRSIVTNPLIVGCAVGIAISLAGTGLPWGMDSFLGFLGQASLPLGLLCVGAALRPRALGREIRVLAGISVLRLLAMPLLAFGMALIFGLGADEAAILVIFAAIPTASTAYVLTQQMGGDGRLMAGIVTAQTLAALFTIPFVLGLLGIG